ncbi:heterokaryon incompatibility protein-domain-containing protein [Microdochium bolleyi]|uniref:Heterokaryon incompatibility protein-domain-containing protein n=1 Tax=Microdochium bolleyi TaxID=196109 RepID=A0A136IUV7_9PEZI|nr:heterokaryon incompatibility protein-domain-containing protein [Microdochium bolleyi]
MKSSLDGLWALGLDGVLRTFDGERNVLDARRLGPAQIREYVGLERLPDVLVGVDGRHVSEWDLYHPAAIDIPRKPTAEDRARTRREGEELLRQGLTCDNPSMTTTYKYRPLDSERRMIRLVTIHPGTVSEDIVVSLEEVTLDNVDGAPVGTSQGSTSGKQDDMTMQADSLSYECLSYTWGSEDDPLPVYVDRPPASSGSGNRIMVTRNLEQALRHLRSADQPRRFFIDALCIDQSNLVERGEQVAMMGHVYRRAATTTIWLGPAADDSDRALALVQEVGSRLDVNYYLRTIAPAAEVSAFRRAWGGPATERSDQDKKAVFALLGRSWFSRLWVRQELVLSRAPRVVCGHKTVQWAEVSAFVYLLHRCTWKAPVAISKEFMRRRELVSRLCAVEQDGMSYGDLRGCMHEVGFKDPRDVVYAIQEILPADERLVGLKPDYLKPVADVYRQVAAGLATQKRDLSFLSGCELASLSLPGLSTWVPDWSRPEQVFSPICSGWSACAWLSAQAQEVPGGTLRAAGVRAGVVSAVVNPRDFKDKTTGRWSAHRALRKMAEGRAWQSEYVGGGTLVEALCHVSGCGPYAEHYEVAETTNVTTQAMVSYMETAVLGSAEPIADGGRARTRAGAGALFESHSYSMLIGRCYFWTEEGYMGLGPRAALAGDVVSVVLGSKKPLLLRPAGAPGQPGKWQVVGPVLVPGLMEGEAIHGPWAAEWQSYDAESVPGIDQYPMCMRNTRDGSILGDPAEILRTKGFEVREYARYPHVLDVEFDELRRKGVEVEYLDLV